MTKDREKIEVSLKGKKILIAEDNNIFRSILNDYLSEFGCYVHEASNGKDALNLAKSNSFDIILTDIKMPYMNGIELIRNLPINNKKAIRIMMSGDASIEDVVSGFKQEIDDFLIKPCHKLSLVYNIIERQLIRSQLQEELNFKKNIFKQYNKILQFMISNNNPEKLFQYIFSSLKNLINFNKIELLLLDSERKNLFIKYILSDTKLISKPGDTLNVKDSFYEPFLTNNHSTVLKKLNDSPLSYSLPFLKNAISEGMKSTIIFPMTVNDLNYGFMLFYSVRERHFTSIHENILKGIVPKISVSFERAMYQGRLFEENTFLKFSLKNLSNQIQTQQDALIFSLAELAEKRDKETGYHLIRMKYFARLLASQFFANIKSYNIGYGKMDKKHIIDLIDRSAPLHDIGKVGIPDSILLKPGKLNKNEFDIIKTHTIIGAECLDNAAQKINFPYFLYVCKDIAKYHHERWDGNGYPDGIEGDLIPITARIVALADTYDALRSYRVYKAPWKHEDVIDYIKDQKGKQFDPNLVNLFIKHEKEINSIYSKFSN